MITKEMLPQLIDLSCVRGDITKDELEQMVALAHKYDFACYFAMPCYTPWLIEKLKDLPNAKVGGAIGFPSGADWTETKVDVARRYLKEGCRELDMVMNVSALKSRDYNLVCHDISKVREAAGDTPLKVIIEVANLTDDEIRTASRLAVNCGAAYVKTGTGWAGSPTTVHHIEIIRDTIGNSAKIKAAGGVRTLKDIEDMYNAGCTRFGIGVRSAEKILAEAGLV